MVTYTPCVAATTHIECSLHCWLFVFVCVFAIVLCANIGLFCMLHARGGEGATTEINKSKPAALGGRQLPADTQYQ